MYADGFFLVISRSIFDFREFKSIQNAVTSMALQINFERVGATCGRPRAFTKNPQGIHASREDSHALRLPSELGDLRAANADLHSVPRAAQNSPEGGATSATQKGRG